MDMQTTVAALVTAGRSDVEEIVQNHFEALRKGKGGALFIKSETDIGQNFMIRLLVEKSGMPSFYAKCQPPPFVGCYHVWQECFPEFFQDFQKKMVQKFSQAFANMKSSLYRGFLGKIGRKISEKKGLSVEEPHFLFSMEAQFAEFLKKQKLPLVLLLEDIHWADVNSLKILNFVIPALKNTPILFVLVGYPAILDNPELPPSLRGSNIPVMMQLRALQLAAKPKVSNKGPKQILQEIEKKSKLVPFPSLSNDVLRTVLEKVIGEELPFGFARKALALAQGNIMFFSQILLYLSQNGLVQKGKKWIFPEKGIELPHYIEGVFDANLKKVPPEVMRALEYASAYGSHIPIEQWQNVKKWNVPSDSLISACIEHGILQKYKDVEVSFINQKQRETILNSVIPEEKMRIHSEWLAFLSDKECRADRHLYHAKNGKAPEKSLESFLRAGLDAEQKLGYDVALELYQEAAKQFPECRKKLEDTLLEVMKYTGGQNIEDERESQDINRDQENLAGKDQEENLAEKEKLAGEQNRQNGQTETGQISEEAEARKTQTPENQPVSKNEAGQAQILADRASQRPAAAQQIQSSQKNATVQQAPILAATPLQSSQKNAAVQQAPILAVTPQVKILPNRTTQELAENKQLAEDKQPKILADQTAPKSESQFPGAEERTPKSEKQFPGAEEHPAQKPDDKSMTEANIQKAPMAIKKLGGKMIGNAARTALSVAKTFYIPKIKKEAAMEMFLQAIPLYRIVGLTETVAFFSAEYKGIARSIASWSTPDRLFDVFGPLLVLLLRAARWNDKMYPADDIVFLFDLLTRQILPSRDLEYRISFLYDIHQTKLMPQAVKHISRFYEKLGNRVKDPAVVCEHYINASFYARQSQEFFHCVRILYNAVQLCQKNMDKKEIPPLQIEALRQLGMAYELWAKKEEEKSVPYAIQATSAYRDAVSRLWERKDASWLAKFLMERAWNLCEKYYLENEIIQEALKTANVKLSLKEEEEFNTQAVILSDEEDAGSVDLLEEYLEKEKVCPVIGLPPPPGEWMEAERQFPYSIILASPYSPSFKEKLEEFFSEAILGPKYQPNLASGWFVHETEKHTRFLIIGRYPQEVYQLTRDFCQKNVVRSYV